MVGMRESDEEQTLTFTADPATVAAAVEAALASIGDVRDVDQATGRIAGKVKKGMTGFDAAAHVEFHVGAGAAAGQTQVQIQTTRDEGMIDMHGAQKAMEIVLQALQAQPTLAQGSTSGW